MQLIYSGSDSLQHHGVKGQRWGKRMGPPYPLDAGGHSAMEKKKKWRSSLNNKIISNSTKRNGVSRNKIIQDKQRSDQLSSRDAPREYQSSKMSSSQKKKLLAIGLGAVAAAGIGIGLYCAYKKHAVDNIAEVINKTAKTIDVDDDVFKRIMKGSLDDIDKVFKKGDVLHRMEAYSNVDFSKVKKPTYMAYKKDDVATYMTLLKDWSGTGKRYDVVFNAAKDLKLPSKKKAVEVFEDLWKNDPSYKNELLETITKSLTKLGESPSEATKQAKQWLERDPFEAAVYSIVKQEKDSAKLIDKLKDLGYDGIEDYFDINNKVARSPVIMFNPSEALIKKGETLVTKEYKSQTLTDLYISGQKTMQAGQAKVIDILTLVRMGRL